MKKTILAIFFILVASIVHAEQYLCIADSAVGFSFNKTTKMWERTNFSINDFKYVISESKLKDLAYQITQMGYNIPHSFCKDSFNEYGFLNCSGFGEFKFNKKNGRFISSYLIGYYNVLPEMNNITDENSGDTPSITIGKCSPF